MYLGRRWYGISRKWFENDSVMTRERVENDSVVTRLCFGKILAVLAIIFSLGSGNVWGADYSFVSSTPSGWTTSPSPNGYETSNLTRGAYWTSNFSLTFAGVSNVTQIEITYSTNNNQTGFSVTVGGNSWGGETQALSSGDRHATKTFSGSAISGDIVISCAYTNKTIYVENISITTGGGSDCDNCEYYVYNGSSFVKIGETGSTDVVLTPPNLDNHSLAGSYGGWSIYEDIQDELGCVYNPNNNNHEYRFVPNPAGAAPDDDNKPSGACKLYAVYYNGSTGCLDTKVSAPNCVRYVEPQDLTSTVSGSNATLSWTDESPTPATKYYLTLVGDDYSWDGEVTTTSKSFTSLPAGDYMWEVYAISTTDDQCNSTTNDDSFTIVGCTDISSSTVTGVSVTPSKVGGSATWTAVANATSYEVKVYAGTATSGVALFSAEPTSNSCTITGLSASTQYTVVVKAKNSCSTSNQGTATWTTSALTLYTVTFHNAAGSAPSAVTQTTEGGTVSIPSASACEGWTFVGWKVGSAQSSTTTDPTSSGTWITSASWPKTDYTPTGNITVHAVFKHTEGGGSGAAVNTVLFSENWTGATNGSQPTGPTDDGSTVYGSATITYSWDTSSDKVYDTGGPNSNENILVSCGAAHYWEASGIPTGGATELTISYAMSGSGTVGLSSSTTNVTIDGNSSGSTISIGSGVTSFTLRIANTNTGSKKNMRIDDIEVKVKTAGSTGTTTWRSDPPCASEYTVTYNAGDATSGTAPTDSNSPYAAGSEVTILGNSGNLGKTGKVFGGWSLTLGGSKAYDVGDKIASLTSNVTLYPYWVNPPYTVTFNAEGGTCGTASLTEASGGAGVTLPEAVSTCSEWSFAGWKESAQSETSTDISSSLYEAGSTYYPSTDNVELHAVYATYGSGSNTTFAVVNNTMTAVQDGYYVITYNRAATLYALGSSAYVINPNTGRSGVASIEVPSTSAASSATLSSKDPVWQFINVSGSNYRIRNYKTGQYLKATDNNNELIFSATADDNYSLWTITCTTEDNNANTNTIKNVATNDYLIKYSSANCYVSQGTTPQVLYFYRVTTAPVFGSATYNSNPSCPTHEVTIGSHTNGTIEVNGLTDSPQTVEDGNTVEITATPESGYRFTGWTVTKTTGGDNVTSTLLAGDKATTASTDFTMPAYDVTVSATFEAIVYYTITWKVNNANYTTYTGAGTLSTTAESGSKWSALTLPDNPADNTLSACDRTKFVGWSTSTLTGDGNSAPADLFKTTSDANADSHTITGNTTFYAVFAKGSGEGWEKVTSAPDDWCGDYLLVYEASSSSVYVWNGSVDASNYVTATPDEGIISKPSGAIEITIEHFGETANYAIKVKEGTNAGKYFQGSSSNGFTLEDEQKNTTIGSVEDVGFTFTNSSSYLRFNTTSGQTRFRYYKLSTAKQSSYKTISLYQQAANYSDYVTSCACSWNIDYITNGLKDGNASATWSHDNCFVEVGSTAEWQIEDFTMPNVAGQFWVGPGEFKAPAAWGHSVIADLSTIKYVLRSDKSRTTYSAVSNMVGTLNMWSDGTDDNYHAGIYPDYQITYGVDGGSDPWTKVDFSYISSTTYETEVVTAPTYFAVSNFKYYVGVKTTGNTGYGGKSSTVMMNTMSGMTTNQDGKHGKWRMYEDSGSDNWYCAWIPYYVLSYDANGGSGAPAAETAVSSEGNAAARTVTVSSTEPTRDGYTFLGWATTTAHATAGTVDYTAGNNIVLTEDVTLYAVWAQNFTVTYDLNGGAADPICSGGTYYVGQSVTVCSTTPTKTSSSFLGWKRLDTDATVAGGSTFTMPSNNVTIQAQWETVYFHIYYKEEDGTAIATDDVPQTAETTLRNQTPCAGYTFFGWSTSKITSETTSKPSIIGKGGASYTPTADITVYPVFARVEGASDKNDVITKDINGGAGSYTAFSNVSYVSDAKYAGCTNTQSSTDLAWNASNGVVTTASGGRIKHVQVVFATACTNPRSVYVYGKNTAYSTFVKDAFPTGAAAGTLIATATKTTTMNTGEVTVELPAEDEDFEDEYNYIALGADNAIRLTSVKVTWSTGTTYYATHCETKTDVTITYDANGGTTTCGNGSHQVTWDYADGGAGAPALAESQTICSAATRDGYVLHDWTTSQDGSGTHYNPGQTVTSMDGDKTLYAQWDRVYTVTFDNQGVTTPVTQASEGATIAVPAATTACSSEWAFVGWSETAIAPKSLLPSLEIEAGTSTYTPTADKTLYAIYRKTSTSSAFVAGMSGAYKIKATYNATDYYAQACNNSKLPATTTAGDGTVFYISYTSADGGKYTIQQANGEYVKYAGSSTSLELSDDAYYWTFTANGSLWSVFAVGSGDRYLRYSHEVGFKAYNTNSSANYLAFVAADGQYYYRTMSCEDDFDIIFHNNGTTINWAGGYPEATYKDLADATVISTFPTASFDGWTFLGWRTADYTESTDAPASSGIYGGTDGTSGNTLTIASANIDLYPVFTKFDDNDPFDQINGGDYYIYFRQTGSDDGYGGENRVYAATYDGEKRYNSAALCSGATEFTFTKLANGKWTIKDKNTNKYLYAADVGEDKLMQSTTAYEWTIIVRSGNQFDAICEGQTYGQLIANGDGTSATFMSYRITNIENNPGVYHPVYLGSCTNRTFTTNPSTTPNVEIHGQAKVTSTAGKSIKAASVLTVSASNIATANLTVTSDNSAFKFCLTSNGTYTASVNIPVVSNKVGITPIYIEYTPTAPTDGIEDATITVSDGASPTPTTVSTAAGDLQGRHVPANFVIAAKWGDKWYALPANCTESTSSTTGVLIEVDDASDPTRATAAPSYTKWGLQTVRPGRKATYGSRLVFTEQLTTTTADNQKTLYNGSTTNIQANAQYSNYATTNPDNYEWLPTTTDLKDYILTSATTLGGDASARTVSLSNKGVFGTLLINKSNDGKVRILPADFYEPVEMQVIEWKENSLVVMYGGAGIKATTQVGNNDPGSLQTLASAKVDHGVYELSTSQDLTSSTNMPLTIAVKNGSDVTTGTCALIVPAIVTGNQDAPLGLTADEATLTDVIVTDGATLSAAATKYTFKNITVYPGGKLVIGSGKLLGMNSLTLRGGSSWGAATYEHKYPQFVLNNTTSGAYTNSAGVINYDYVTTKDQYYSFVLPYASNTKNIKYPVDIYGSNVSASNTGSFEFQYYDGEARAAGGTGWAVLAEDPSTGAGLNAGTGYTFLGMPKKIYAYDGTETRTNVRQRYGIHRIPMSVAAGAVQSGETTDKNITIDVTLAMKNNDSGWNLIGNPYMSNVSGLTNTDIQVGKLVHVNDAGGNWTGRWQWDNTTTGVRYIVTTDDGQTFESQQASTATLKAFKNFFVQIQNGEANTLVIPANSRTDKLLAPARYMDEVEQDIQLAIDLISEARKDKVDLLINDIYTAEFDQDGDFTKMMNSTNFNLYGVYPGDNLSFIAVDKTTAANSIAVGYQVPAGGDYTLQLSDREYVMTDAIEALYVTDHEVSPEVTTDLLDGPYNFHVNNAETNDTRFTISIRLVPKTPTDLEIVPGEGMEDMKPQKFIYHDKMYILRGGVIYDTTGKKVGEINK